MSKNQSKNMIGKKKLVFLLIMMMVTATVVPAISISATKQPTNVSNQNAEKHSISRTVPSYIFTHVEPILQGTGNYTIPVCMNNVGQMVGTSRGREVLWNPDGSIIDIGDSYYFGVAAINDAGQIAGTIFNYDEHEHAVVWQNGLLTYLPELPNFIYRARAKDINNAGQIVGYESGTGGIIAVIWQQGLSGWQVRNISRIDYNYSTFANGINDAGWIAGSVDVNATVWMPDGSGGYIQNNLGMFSGDRDSESVDINDNGFATGVSVYYPPGGGWVNHPFQWLPYTGTLVPMQIGGYPMRMNNNRDVVGYDHTLWPYPVAVLWHNMVRYDLNTLVVNPPLYPLTTGMDINNRGQIVGEYGSFSGSTNIRLGFRLTPVTLGDMNIDGRVNSFDIDPFILALTNPQEYSAQHDNLNPVYVGDINHDGLVNAFDIDPFIALLNGQ